MDDLAPVEGEVPSSWFLDEKRKRQAVERDRDAAITRLGAIILALRQADTEGLPVPGYLRAGIFAAESEFFNVPTSEGAARRAALAVPPCPPAADPRLIRYYEERLNTFDCLDGEGDVCGECESCTPTPVGQGHPGMVTVWNHDGTYAGCMGVETWRRVLADSEAARERRRDDDPGMLRGVGGYS